MATQLDQWEIVVTSGTQTGKYVGDSPSFRIDMPRSAIWAHSHLGTIVIHDDNASFAGIYFTEYSYEDEDGKTVTVNVDHPDYKYKKQVLISSWTMTSLTYKAESRNVGVRGLVILELWQGW